LKEAHTNAASMILLRRMLNNGTNIVKIQKMGMLRMCKAIASFAVKKHKFTAYHGNGPKNQKGLFVMIAKFHSLEPIPLKCKKQERKTHRLKSIMKPVNQYQPILMLGLQRPKKDLAKRRITLNVLSKTF